jgi:hypothetical protein
MIVDQVILAGDRARFLSGVAGYDLSAAGAPAVIGPLPDGSALEVTGVALTLQADDVESLVTRTGAGSPLIAVGVTKEMFRGLFKDPYAHRVFTISGFEDFRRGTGTNVQAMEYEGHATLVSRGSGTVEWMSSRYQLPEAVEFTTAAWDVAASTATHPDAFRYSLQVSLWEPGSDLTANPDTVAAVAADARPDSPMHTEGVGRGNTVQIRFAAEVLYESYIHEQHPALGQDVSLGTPLLRSVHLFEAVPPAFTLMSLLELQVRSREFLLHRGRPNAAPNTVTAVLDLPCHLGRGESIQIEFRPGAFTRAEAWLVATSLTRPPVAEG